MKIIKFFLKKIILIIIPNSYIKRRHFHHSTYYKDKFYIMAVFNNNFFRNLIFKLLSLIKNNSQIHTVFKGKKFLASTSGSSGQSLKFYRDESADSFNRAVLEKNYLWYLINPWERNGYFWGFNFS